MPQFPKTKISGTVTLDRDLILPDPFSWSALTRNNSFTNVKKRIQMADISGRTEAVNELLDFIIDKVPA